MLLNPMDRYLEKKYGQEDFCDDFCDSYWDAFFEGRFESLIDIAKNLLNEGFSVEQVVRLTELSEKDVLSLI